MSHDATHNSTHPLATRRAIVTLALIGIGAIIFYSSQWYWLRQIQVTLLAWIASETGLPCIINGFTLTFGNWAFEITRDCTYLEWMLYAAPLLWRDKPLLVNTLCITAILGAVFVLNIIRSWLAIYWSVCGVPWFWAHDLLDYVAWYGTLAIVAALWLTRQRRLSPE